MHTMSTEISKLFIDFVWKHGNDVKFWRHKQCTPNTNNHHTTLNQPPPHENFLRTPLADHNFTTSPATAVAGVDVKRSTNLLLTDIHVT